MTTKSITNCSACGRDHENLVVYGGSKEPYVECPNDRTRVYILDLFQLVAIWEHEEAEYQRLLEAKLQAVAALDESFKSIESTKARIAEAMAGGNPERLLSVDGMTIRLTRSASSVLTIRRLEIETPDA